MISASAPLVAMLLAAPAAGEGHVSATSTTTAEVHLDNANTQADDDNYGVLYERLHLVGGVGDLSASARLDFLGVGERPSTAYRSDARIERIAVQLPVAGFRLTAGDMYQELGRGILLSLRKADDVSLDVALRGVEARYVGGIQEARLFTGVTNPVNFDAVSQKYIEDVEDFVSGVDYSLRGPWGLTVGAHAVYVQPQEMLLDTVDRSAGAGVRAELPALFDFVSLYAELDAQQRVLAGTPGVGLAGYATADLRFGDSGLLLEGLFLDDFEQKGSRNTALNSRFNYNRAPTLERIQEEVLQNRDVTGARMRVEHYLVDLDLLLYVNAVVRLNERGEPAELRQGHAYGGGEWYFQEGRSRLAASGGFRDERQTSGTTRKTMVHAEADYLQAIGGGFSLHLSTLNELRTLDENDYVRGSTFAGVERSGLGGLTFELGVDTQNPAEGVRKLFFAGVLAVDVIDPLRAQLVAGTRRGGIKCVAGVCREFPPFAGVAAEVVARY